MEARRLGYSDADLLTSYPTITATDLVNAWVYAEAHPDEIELIYAEGILTLVVLLAPFAPHIADELWHLLGESDSVHTQSWPSFDPVALVADEITLVIQIMGKTRGAIQVPAQADKAALEKYARESEIAQRYIEGKEIKKVIVVPGKLVNFVVS